VTGGGISKPESSKPRGNAEALAAADISSPNEAFMPANGITLLDLEREHILETLRRCLGNRTHTARSLGISVRGLSIKLATYAKMGAEVPPPSPHSSHFLRRNSLRSTARKLVARAANLHGNGSC
jgi:Bacterial regulatory protein, Fis family